MSKPIKKRVTKPVPKDESRTYAMKRTDWMDDKNLLDPSFDDIKYPTFHSDNKEFHNAKISYGKFQPLEP